MYSTREQPELVDVRSTCRACRSLQDRLLLCLIYSLWNGVSESFSSKNATWMNMSVQFRSSVDMFMLTLKQILKPILHSLLIPNTLNFLSVASNRRLIAPAFKLIGSFVQKSNNLQFLDLSQNVLDKKSVEYIGSALKPASASGLVSLRLDDCSLRPASLETLGTSLVSHIFHIISY